MRKTFLLTGGLMALALVLLLFAENEQQSVDSVIEEKSQLKVAASIFPIANIAQNIAGSNAEVVQILPNGASPHSFSLSPQQLVDLQDASLVFTVGYGLDEWMPIGASSPAIIVDNGVHLVTTDHDHEHDDENDDDADDEAGLYDPHYWLSVPNAKIIAENIAEELSRLDPVNTKRYQQNLRTYSQELDELETELQELALLAKNVRIITTHDAWGNLEEQYGFEVIATYEPEEGVQPTIADLAELQRIIKEYNIEIFYTEPQKRSSAAVSFISREFGLEIAVLDPIGGQENNRSYIELMRSNMSALVNPNL